MAPSESDRSAPEVERRLAAILAADIVGYSRLTEADEAGTLAAIRTLRREVIDPLLAQHHGRIVKLTGDGVIVEFGSVVDAVNNAVAIQKETPARQTEVPPEKRIVFRVGINLGDVVVEDDDLMGDGVNVAARLEQLCEPGGVLVSGTAYDQLQGKFDLPLDFAGEQHVKNIARPVRIYQVGLDGNHHRLWRLRVREYSGRMKWAAAVLVILIGAAAATFWLTPDTEAGPPAIAVLPFENINGDEKWDRFAIGVTEDIITDLARYREIPVIARTSTEVYGDKAHDVREIGRALNVKYVLEGSLQVDGHRLRVTAQLINAETGAHVWSERYDRPAAELLDVQDEITEKIAATLIGWQGQVAEAERALRRRKGTVDLDAYDYWLLGIEAKHRMTPESQIEARAFFEKGLKLAPDFMPLSREMAYTYVLDLDIGSAVDYQAWADAYATYAKRAFALDPNDAGANFAIAGFHARQGDVEQAERHLARALQLAPNNPDILMQLAWVRSSWETEKAIELVERALRLSPRYPSWWNYPIMLTYFGARQFDKAYAAAKQVGESPNQSAYLAMSAARLGKTEAAFEAAARVLRMRPDWTAESMVSANFADATLLPESAALAGLPVCMTAAQINANPPTVLYEECDEERARGAVN